MMMNRREIIDELKEIVADMAAKEPHKRDWFDALREAGASRLLFLPNVYGLVIVSLVLAAGR